MKISSDLGCAPTAELSKLRATADTFTKREGFKVVIGKKPDLVICGVNRGQNLADDVTYSGTVAGAMEGALLGIPSVALSQAYGVDTRDDPPFATAEAPGARSRT